MDYAAYNRGERLKDFKIVSQITLRRDSGNVYIETAIDNNVKDHRLKLMLPTNIKGDKYVAAQAFYFAERNVGADPEGASGTSRSSTKSTLTILYTKPMKTAQVLPL